jgi:ParB-like chromosome segregation protein Spo0J
MKHRHTYKRILISQIVPDPDSVHSKYSIAEDDSDLRASIQEFAVMNGLLVCPSGKGRYLIIDGERRYRIARDLGLRELECTVLPAMDAAEREKVRVQLYMTHKPLTQAERGRQRRRARQLGVTPLDLSP